jgi:hypothetical protein
MYGVFRDLLTGVGNFIAPSKQDQGPFVPDYKDVCKTRALLIALNLPMELVLEILDHAQYWPSITWSTPPGCHTTAIARSPQNSHACICIDAPVVSNVMFSNIASIEKKVEVKAIEFKIKSRDQGWTSENTHGTFNTSSWLEVSILRPNADQTEYADPDADDTYQDIYPPLPFPMMSWYNDPRGIQEELNSHGQMLVKRPEHVSQGPQGGEGDLAWYIQGNRVAAPLQTYTVVWTRYGSEGNEGAGTGEGFVKALQKGDAILVWARAKVSCKWLV